MKSASLLASLTLALGVAGTAATAATMGFELTLDKGKALPRMTLKNISDTATLESVNVTIGNAGYNFDRVYYLSAPADGTSTLTGLDNNNYGGVRSDDFDIAFTGFDPNEVVSWEMDIDIDNTDSTEDHVGILFNNGAAPNSVVRAGFSTAPGMVEFVSLTLSDSGDGSATRFVFTATADSSPVQLQSSAARSVSAPVPLPAALPLLLAALGGLGFAGWRRRRAGSA